MAIWLWYEVKGLSTEDLRYKGKGIGAEESRKKVKAHWKVLCDIVDGAKALPQPKDNDELDCLVAWLLARNWIARKGVIQLGNQSVGSFLVPELNGLKKEFEDFLTKEGLSAESDAEHAAPEVETGSDDL